LVSPWATQEPNSAATTILCFITLALTGLFLFLKITRWIRIIGEYRRGQSRRARLRGKGRKGKGRNAFEEEEWEGVAA
jgi:hypothetical protein